MLNSEKMARSLIAPLPEDIASLVYSGQFSLADEVIGLRLKRDMPEELRLRLMMVKEMELSLRRRYIYSFAEAFEAMKAEVEDITEAELDRLWKEGAIDWRYIDGEMRFIDNFPKNIVDTRPEYRARSKRGPKAGEELRDYAIAKMIRQGQASYKIKIRHSLSIKPEAQKPGQIARVHLPLPLEEGGGMASGLKILKPRPGNAAYSPGYYPVRTVCLTGNSTDEFIAEYEYTSTARYIVPDPNEAMLSSQPSFETEEILPHVVFTPYIRSVAGSLAGTSRNPVEIAKRIYDFVTKNIQYSYMRDYFALESICEYALTSLKGDCGVQALLFICLCRANGIPARWHSGLWACPGAIGSHDWAQYYIAPYGWLFADCSFGGSAYREGSLERHEFYSSNIEPFRMASNRAFQYQFIPAKKHMRIDPYDSQTGEAEYEGSPLKAGELSIKLEVEATEL